MIASNNDDGGEHPEIVVANLKSPAFYAGDHPLECFAFWFYFSVSNTFLTLQAVIYLKRYYIQPRHLF